MVIGDSLAQGCRSLTVRQEFCAQSWPAQLANAQGWTFRSPDLPQPVLFDLEEEVRRLGDLVLISPGNVEFGGVITRLMANLRGWLANRRTSRFAAFDNLGLSGAQPADLYTRSASTSQQEIERIIPHGGAEQILLHRGEIGALHLAINAHFTLNPSQDPAFSNLTPLDWVRARLPKRLFLQIGHNNGLYAIGSNATDKPFDQPNDNGDTFLASFQRIGAELAALPAEVERIVCVLLPKVGAVANLRPQDATRKNGYAETYEPVLSTSRSVFTGTRLAEIDRAIDAMNGQIKSVLTAAALATGTEARLLFFDSFAMFERYDFKNSLDPAKRISLSTPVNAAIDNFYVTGRLVPQTPWPPGTPPWRKELARGGFQSVDGMHPSACGYAVLAHEMMTLLGLGNNDLGALLATAFADDALLHDFPMKLNALVDVLGLLRGSRQLGMEPVVPKPVIAEGDDNLHVLDAIGLFKQLLVR